MMPKPSANTQLPQLQGELQESPIDQVEQLQQRIGELQLQLEELRHVHVDLEVQNESLRHTINEMERSQQKQTTLFTEAPLPYIELLPNGIIARINDAAAACLGESRGSLTDRLLLPRIKQEDRTYFVAHIQKALQSKQPESISLTMSHADGTWLRLALNTIAVRPNLGDSAQLRILFIDETERVQFADNLQRELRQAQLQLNGAPVGIFLLDHLGCIQAYNPHTQCMLGLKDLQDKPFAELWLDKLLDSQKPFLASAEDEYKPLPSRCEWLTYFNRHKQWQGYLRPAYHQDAQKLYHVHILTTQNAQGESTGSQGILVDVTHLTHLQAQKDEFTSIISHELRTPLTSLIGSLKLLRAGMFVNIDARSAQILDIALRNSDRLLYLINDILDIGKLEAGGLELKLQTTQLSPMIHKTLEDNKEFALSYGIKWDFKDLHPESFVTVDTNRLQQVLTNLLSNAAKFSHESDTVRIEVVRQRKELRLQVIDEGEGVPEPFRPLLFKKFAQHDTMSSRKNQGTGLGLYISKSLIEAMQGRLTYEPNPQGGSIFAIHLPETYPENLS